MEVDQCWCLIIAETLRELALASPVSVLINPNFLGNRLLNQKEK